MIAGTPPTMFEPPKPRFSLFCWILGHKYEKEKRWKGKRVQTTNYKCSRCGDGIAMTTISYSVVFSSRKKK